MIYSIVNQKGGTGKTTTTVNLGCALAHYKMKVLLIDLDPQGNLSFSFGLQSKEYTISQLLNGEINTTDGIVSKEDLDIIPANINLANTEINIIRKKSREFVLRKLLKELDYDFILIDCPPSLSMLTINALTASDKVLIPMQPEVLSIKGLDLIIDTIEGVQQNFNEDIEIDGILPVMVDTRKRLSKDVLKYITDNYSTPIMNTRIRTNVRASEAPSFGKSVIAYAPGSTSAIDYLTLAKEIIARRN